MAQLTFDPAAVIDAAKKIADAASVLRDSIEAEHEAEDNLASANSLAAGARADVEAAKGKVDDGVTATLDAEQNLIKLLQAPTVPPQGDAAANASADAPANSTAAA